jgi:acyl-CoA synthetase (AMP-forming)/AMP-acid ligase II
MLLDMAAEGFGDRTVIGALSGGLSAHDLRTAARAGATLITESDATSVVYLASKRIEAVVTPARGIRLDTEDLRVQVRTSLRGSKTPDRIVVWDEILRTATGKVRRHDVAAHLGQ